MSLAIKILNASYEGIVLGVVFPNAEPAPVVALKNPDRIFLYKSKVPLAIGSHVIVPVKEDFWVGEVYSVVDETALDLDYAGSYKWIVGPVDFFEYNDRTSEDEALVAQVTKAQRQNIRQQVLESVRSVGLDPNALLETANASRLSE